MFREAAVTVRRLAQEPWFTLATVGTLALGIAATTALFTTVNAALLRPLPFPQPQDIYAVTTRITDGRYTSGLAAPAELGGLQEASDRVLHASGAHSVDLTLLTDAGPIKGTGYGVWRDFFDLFGVPMTLGRAFSRDEHVAGAPYAMVLSHHLWRRVFGADPDIVGTSLRFPDFSVMVVGVAGPGFDVPRGADFWLNFPGRPDDISHILHGYVRLRPESTVADLEAPMTQVMEDLAVKFPDQNRNRVFVLTPLLDAVVGDLRPILLIVFAATALLLALACLNVANLMTARATVRSREIAIRSALGASRWRIARASLLESLLLAAGGGLLGVIGAYIGLRVLLATGASRLARLDDVAFDPAVLLFAFATTLAAGLIVAVVPGLRHADSNVAMLMNEGGRGSTGSSRTRRLLAALVAVEIAVGMALVAGTGRMVQSYANLRAVDAGFTQADHLIVDVLLPGGYRNPERHAAWFADVALRVRGLGATAVAAASSLPLRTEWDTTTFVDLVNDPTTDPHQRPNGRRRIVSPNFFDVMGARMVAGRAFTDRDRQDAPAVAIVNEAFVRRFFAGRDPLRERVTIPGFRMRREDGRIHHEDVAVVGVVADMKYAGLHVPVEQTVYLSQAQFAPMRQSLVVSTAGERPGTLASQVVSALHAVDPQVAVSFDSTSQVLDASLSRQRLGMILMVLFGLAALGLIVVGVLGVTGFVVAQRTGEMAVRAALGATRPRLLWEVFSHGARLVAIGMMAGIALTWWTGRLLSAYVYEVGAADPLVIGFTVVTVLMSALGAIWLPARRAAAVEPSQVLRSA